MSFIKKHKLLLLMIFIFIILIVVAAIFCKNIFSSNDSNSKYGNRLDGIEQVEIKESRLNNIKEKLLDNKNTNTVSYNVSGRIIKFMIEVKSETDELSVEELLNIILTNFTEQEKSFYDFEVFISNETEEELYPQIAYKHRNNSKFTITKKVGN